MANYRKIDEIQSNRIAMSLDEMSDMSAHRRRGSGSKWYAQGDVYSEMFLIEAKDKASPSKQRTVHKDWFDKVATEAVQEGKIPLVVIGFGDGQDFCAMEDSEFYNIIKRMRSAEGELEYLRDMSVDDFINTAKALETEGLTMGDLLDEINELRQEVGNDE